MARRYIWNFMIFMCLIGLILFGGQGGATTDSKKIGVVLLTREHQFFRELEEGLTNEAKKNNLKVQILFAEYSHNRQVLMVDDLIAKKVDALIISPCDSKAIGDTIEKANEADIPVFTVDIANLSDKGKVITHISSDNFEGGRQAGRLMADALKGKGKIVIINHPNITSCIDRVNGFRDVIKDYPSLQIVADIPAWGQRSRAMSIMEDLLLMMPDVKGVFAINEDSALGAARAIDAAGKTGKIIVVGYDATPEGRKAIESGKIYGEVIQYPKEIARLLIDAVCDYFDGKPVKPYIPVKVGVFTR
ncbi:MAG TPA: sugar ABC transporter substrate-binding protein [Firmicutes bacterium]|jgi:ribose transport system substrate-binding protein|nr:sugar ABC transporter substrate-binding protein [Bacillota bacterium]